jgi:hypothetical protein
MLPQTNNQQSAPYTTVTQAPSTSTTQKNRQYKQIFQPSSGQQQQTGQATKQQVSEGFSRWDYFDNLNF